MASDLYSRGKEAFIDDHFELAVELYSQAISINPNRADLFADRAQANIKLNYFTEAVGDANRAIEFDPKMSKAYLRKGVACVKLEEYETAKVALEKGAILAPEDSRFIDLIKECDKGIAEEAAEAELQKISLKKASLTTSTTQSESPDKPDMTLKKTEALNNMPAQATVSGPSPNYRHEFYQKPEEVVITIFAKNVPHKSVTVDFGEQIVSVIIEMPGLGPYMFQPRLFGKILAAKCKYEVLSTKIEIHLAKANATFWPCLEFSKDYVAPQSITISSGDKLPTYPSSKLKRVDWDKLEAQVKKEEKEEKLDGDAALNRFFQGIFKDSDEDTRRAMRKSFTESNGTVLSTSWEDVSSKKVEERHGD